MLLIHLRMTGSLRHSTNGLDDDPHRRALIRLDDGSDLAYRDVRRFGTWLLLEPGELAPYLAPRLGEEPLEMPDGLIPQRTDEPLITLAMKANLRRWLELEMLDAKIGGLLDPGAGVVQKKQ